MTYGTSQGQPIRRGMLRLVIALAPHRVVVDRLAGQGVQGDGHRRWTPGAGNRDNRPDALRVMNPPFNGLHGSHAAANHCQQLVNAKVVQKKLLGPHHVAHHDHWKLQIEWLAASRVDAGRSR